MASLREERYQEKHQLILKKAEKLIYSQGYQSTSMKDIAAACGLGMNAIYSVFGSKEQICAELYFRAEGEFADRFKSLLNMDKPFPVKIRDLVQEYIDFYARHNFLYEIVWLVLNGQLESLLNPVTVNSVHTMFEELVTSVTNLLEQLQGADRIRTDLDCRTMTATFWTMLSGMAANYSHKTQELTGVPHMSIRETELDMILDYMRYRGRK